MTSSSTTPTTSPSSKVKFSLETPGTNVGEIGLQVRGLVESFTALETSVLSRLDRLDEEMAQLSGEVVSLTNQANRQKTRRKTGRRLSLDRSLDKEEFKGLAKREVVSRPTDSGTSSFTSSDTRIASLYVGEDSKKSKSKSASLRQKPFGDLRSTEWFPRARNEIEVRNRKWRLKTYKNCFIASELVDWMVLEGVADSRKGAVRFAQALKEQGLIRHVVKAKKKFSDEYLFFRFVERFSITGPFSLDHHTTTTSETSPATTSDAADSPRIDGAQTILKSVSAKKFERAKSEERKMKDGSSCTTESFPFTNLDDWA